MVKAMNANQVPTECYPEYQLSAISEHDMDTPVVPSQDV